MNRLITATVLTLLFGGCAASSSPGDDSHQNSTERQVRQPDVRYEPSSHRVVNAMLELANVNEKDIVFDLGSGDGRIPITAARKHGARAVGIEIDADLIARARSAARRAAVTERVTFRNQDLFLADISDATVVTLFLSPEVNLRLRPKLLAELRPGARVVSHYHDMGDWKPERMIRVEGNPIYLWIVMPTGARRH